MLKKNQSTTESNYKLILIHCIFLHIFVVVCLNNKKKPAYLQVAQCSYQVMRVLL